MTLVLHGVEHRFGGIKALRGVEACFARGRVTVVLGPNGAGKSTLLRIAADCLRPSGGEVLLDDGPLRKRTRAERAASLGYVVQRPLFGASLSVRAVVELGLVAQGSRRDGRSVVAAAMESLRLTELADAAVTSLSVGQQQRVAIARTLAQTDAVAWRALPTGAARDAAPDAGRGARGRLPPFLLLDEPFASLDPAHVALVLELLRGCAAARCGVVAAVHDLPAASALADDVLILRDGRVVASGGVEEVLVPSVLESVYETRFDRLGATVLPRLRERA